MENNPFLSSDVSLYTYEPSDDTIAMSLWGKQTGLLSKEEIDAVIAEHEEFMRQQSDEYYDA